MGETVGSYIKKRAVVFSAIAGSGMIFTIWRIAAHGPGHPGTTGMPGDVMLGIAWTLAGMVALRRMKCPICSGMLGRFFGFSTIGFGKGMKHCPDCGVSFDKPMV